jgi:zinc transport system substrate-binding protein
MKKIIISLIIGSTVIFAKINTVVSILPQQTFLKAIGGDKVDISLMVKLGNSPHTYEPKPSQMIKIDKADLYFAIGVEFENIWLDKFKSLNPNMKIVDTTKNITKLHIKKYTKNNKFVEKLDPHIWTNPANVKQIAINIYEVLVKYDSNNSKYYKINLDKFIKNIENTHNQIKQILKKSKNNKFMVFHPSWGYFANEYNLIQLPIEIEGKKPKPKELISLIKKAKKEKIRVIFISPEFSHKLAKTLANELNIKVKRVSPLNPKWSKNLIDLAKAISN